MTTPTIHRYPLRAARYYWQIELPTGDGWATHVAGWSLTKWGARRAARKAVRHG